MNGKLNFQQFVLFTYIIIKYVNCGKKNFSKPISVFCQTKSKFRLQRKKIVAKQND